jgi:uncharacterized membrane protein
LIFESFLLFLSWVVNFAALSFIGIVWCAYFGWLTNIRTWSLEFIDGSLPWAIGLTVAGICILAVGIFMARFER